MSVFSQTEYQQLIKIFSVIPMIKFHEEINFEFNSFPYQFIGKGTTRLVYDLGNGYVIKVAYTPYGMVQNYNELILSSLFAKAIPIITPVLWANDVKEDNCRFLIMKHGAYHNPEWEENNFTEEDYFNALSMFGIDDKELELSFNSVGFNLVDYGGTYDSEPIDLKFIKETLEKHSA